MSTLQSSLAELVSRIVENNLWRQRRCVNLIPSENTPSLLVKLCEISDPSGRYAEHKTALKKEVEALQGSGALKGDHVGQTNLSLQLCSVHVVKERCEMHEVFTNAVR